MCVLDWTKCVHVLRGGPVRVLACWPPHETREARASSLHARGHARVRQQHVPARAVAVSLHAQLPMCVRAGAPAPLDPALRELARRQRFCDGPNGTPSG
eukprot:872985-Pleurochrysis_carterae.AAC.1